MFGHKEHLIERDEARIECLMQAENDGVITPNELEISLRELQVDDDEVGQILQECTE